MLGEAVSGQSQVWGLARGRGKSLLDTSREADDREEQPIEVEGLKDPLHRIAVDAEGDGWNTEVQAAADHVLRGQEVLPWVSHQACHVSCTRVTRREGSEVRGPMGPIVSRNKGQVLEDPMGSGSWKP